jgi:hypothetical protein
VSLANMLLTTKNAKTTKDSEIYDSKLRTVRGLLRKYGAEGLRLV